MRRTVLPWESVPGPKYSAVDTLKRIDDFCDAVRSAGAEIEDLNALHPENVIRSTDMSSCEIDHMDIIAQTGAVRCRIVIAEDRELLPFSDCNLRDIRHPIVRNALRLLTDHTGGMRTDRIEIAQQNHSERRICFGSIL